MRLRVAWIALALAVVFAGAALAHRNGFILQPHLVEGETPEALEARVRYRMRTEEPEIEVFERADGTVYGCVDLGVDGKWCWDQDNGGKK